MQVFLRSNEQHWNIGGNSEEVWNGWRHVNSPDNFWGCGNNFSFTLEKGDIQCTYGASYYHPHFTLIKLNGKSASGSFAYDRSKPKADVYNAFTEFIEQQLKTENA